MSTVIIARGDRRKYSSGPGKLQIFLDGEHLGQMKLYEVVKFQIEPGQHSLQIKTWTCGKSEVFNFDITDKGLLAFRVEYAHEYSEPTYTGSGIADVIFALLILGAEWIWNRSNSKHAIQITQVSPEAYVNEVWN